MFYYYDETDGIFDMIDDVYLFENEKAYLNWYFVKKLSNGMFVRIML